MPRIEFGDFVKFSFYKLHRDWRFLSDAEKRTSKEELAAIIGEFGESGSLRTYSLMGTRADADMLLWQASTVLEDLREIATRIASTQLGRYLDQTHSFLAQRRKTRYKHGGGRPEGLDDAPKKYFIVYPMVKKREWYQLPQERRQEMMNDHFRVGHEYPTVKINTAYSFGLDDQEFVVSFETDEPSDFVSLVMDLREVEGGFYTARETPIFTALSMPVRETLDALGE